MEEALECIASDLDIQQKTGEKVQWRLKKFLDGFRSGSPEIVSHIPNDPDPNDIDDLKERSVIYPAETAGDIVIKTNNSKYAIKSVSVYENPIKCRVRGNFVIGHWLTTEEKEKVTQETSHPMAFGIIIKNGNKKYVDCVIRAHHANEDRYDFSGKVGDL
jgi:hypothetical protein